MTSQPDFLLDVSRLVWRAWAARLPTGIDRVCLAYVAHFGDRARAVVQYRGQRRILPTTLSTDLFKLLLAPSPGFRWSAIRQLWHAIWRREPGDSGRGQIYLNVGHTGLDRPEFVTSLAGSGLRPVYLLHDLIPLTHPEYCRAGEATKHMRRVDTMLRTSVGIICNSQATLDELAPHAAAADMPVPPACVAWLGATPLQADGPAATPTAPQFVMLGTIEGRKNHLLVLQTWSRLAEQFGAATPHLTIIGQRGWEYAQAAAMLDRAPALQPHVTELRRCTDAELGRRLRQARALLFPSFAEGYGMPLVEALGHGTPVIASTLAVFRELAGTIPDYRDPLDGLGWREAIEDYARPDSPARAAQLRRMIGYRAPDWPSHFARVDAWLDTLA